MNAFLKNVPSSLGQLGLGLLLMLCISLIASQHPTTPMDTEPKLSVEDLIHNILQREGEVHEPDRQDDNVFEVPQTSQGIMGQVYHLEAGREEKTMRIFLRSNSGPKA